MAVTPSPGASSVAESFVSDSTLAAIIRSSPDAIITKTADGLVTSWNNSAGKLFGYSAEEMIGSSIEVIYPPEIREFERARRARVSSGAVEGGVRTTRLTREGLQVEVLVSLAPVYDPGGRLITIASVARRVTDVERAEARFGSLLEAAPDATVCVDGNGRIASVNAQMGNLFGYAREELIGQPVEVLMPEDVRGEHRAHRAWFMSDPQLRGMGVDLALTARRRDGTGFPVEISLAPDVSGGDLMVIAAIRDVTAQHEADAVARDVESRLRQVTESVDIVFGLLQLDPFCYLYVSSGVRAVLGREPAEFIGTGRALMDGAGNEREQLERCRLAEGNGQPLRVERRIVLPDGRERWLLTTSTPVPNPDGPVERAVITVEDVTARVDVADALKHAEEAARAAELVARTANHAKNEFLSRMSHELRTPLNAVLGFGQLLARQLADTEYSDSLRHIVKGGRHLLDLINDVLDIARIETGEVSLSTEPVPLIEVVNETIELMQPLAAAAQVELHQVPEGGEAYVQADRQRLRQILLNLLSNAIKYNRRGGSVWVDWSAVEGRSSLTVRDDGLGIPAELMSRLFTPFDRLGVEGSGIEGTGIGLALTRSLAELMGGSITVESTHGVGSAFTLTIASTVPESPTSPAGLSGIARRAEACAVLTPANALYIEDNTSNVTLIEHVLALRPGWRLVHAATGSLGLELAQAHQPDLILLDLHLPDRSGQELLAEIKSRPALRDTPVVILTADASAGLGRQLLAAGAAGFLTKPLEVEDVLAYLDSALARKEVACAGKA